MKALVTGAGGFCGRPLCDHLRGRGLEVHTLGTRAAASPRHHHVADITDVAALTGILRSVRPDYLFHLAGVARSADPALFYRVNVQFAVALLEALHASDRHACPVLLMGTGAEYGMVTQEQLPIPEDLPPRPCSHYGISKLAQTLEGLAAAGAGRPVVVVRPFNIIGPGMPDFISLQSFALQIDGIVKGKRPPVLLTGNLDSIRDFVDVRDVVKILWELVRNRSSYGEVVNICSGRGTRLADAVAKLIELSGAAVRIEQDAARFQPLDCPAHYGSTTKLKRIIGYVPETNLTETLSIILEDAIRR